MMDLPRYVMFRKVHGREEFLCWDDAVSAYVELPGTMFASPFSEADAIALDPKAEYTWRRWRGC